MKDKKLFGKLNIVDIVIILVIIAAAIFFAFRYLNIGNAGSGDTVEIKYTVTIDAMPEALFNAVLPTLPAAMISSEAAVEGTILSASAEPCTVESFESNDPYNSNAIFKIIPDQDDKFVKAEFECTATISASSGQNKLGTQELLIGRPHILKSHMIALVGTITAMTITENP